MSESPVEAAKVAKAQKVRKPRKWRRRFLRLFLLLVIFVLVLRAVAPFAAPRVLAWVGEGFDLKIELEELELSILQGRVKIRGLEVRALGREGEAPPVPLLLLEQAMVQAHLPALLTGELRVKRMGVDGMRLHVSRDEHGRFSFQDQLAFLFEASGTEEENPEAEEPLEEPAPFPLQLPVRVDFLRVQNVVLEYEDLSLDPPLNAALQVDAAVTDFGAPDRDAQLGLSVHSPGLLDLLRVNGVLHSEADLASVEVDLTLSRLHVKRLEGLLAMIGIEARGETLSANAVLGVQAKRREDQPSEVAVELVAREVSLLGDSRMVVGLSSATLWVDRLSFEDIDGVRGEIDGLEGYAGLAADGALIVGPLAIAAADSTSPAVPASTPPPTASSTQDASSAGAIALLPRVTGLALRNGHFEFEDARFDPPLVIECEIDEAALARLSVSDAGAAFPPTEIRLELRAPGLFEHLSVNGRARLSGPARGLALEVEASGITLERARDYLEPLAIEPELVAGRFSAEINAQLLVSDDGVLRGEALVSEVSFSDGEKSLMAMRKMAIEGFEFDPDRALRVSSATVEGIELDFHRTADEVGHFAGLRMKPAVVVVEVVESIDAVGTLGEIVTAAAAEPLQAPAAAGSMLLPSFDIDLPIPRIEIGRLACVDTRLHFVDEALEHPIDVKLTHMGVELSSLVIDEDPEAPDSGPAHLRTWFGAPGLAEELELEGALSIAPGCREALLEFGVRGTGIVPELVEPYLLQAGIESRLTDGSLSLDGRLEFELEERDLRGSFALTNVLFSNNGRELFGLDIFEISGLSVGSEGLELGAISILRPRLTVARDSHGRFLALGMRLVPPTGSEQPVLSDAPPTVAGEGIGDPLGDALASLSKLELPIHLASFELGGAEIEWRDESVWPHVHTQLGAQFALREFALEKGMVHVLADGALNAGDAFEELSFTARADVVGQTITLEGSTQLTGMHPGELEVYLRQGDRVTLEDGSLTAAFRFSSEPTADGGRGASLSLEGLELLNQGGAVRVIDVGRAVLAAKRIDFEAGVFEIEELALRGVELEATLIDDGKSIEVGGVSIVLGGGGAAPVPMTMEEQSAGVLRRQVQLALRDERFPSVLLGKLDVGIARLSVRDERRPEDPDLVLSGRVFTEHPTLLISPDPGKTEPIALKVEWAVTPLVAHGELALRLQPWALEPTLDADLRVEGIDAQEILAFVPELAEQLDASGLRDGRLAAKLEGRLRWRRRGPFDFELANGFGGELRITGLELHEGDQKRALAGVDSIFVDCDRIAPLTGDVSLRSIEIERPYGFATMDHDGIGALGLRMRKPADTEPAAMPTTTAGPVPEVEVADEEMPKSIDPAVPRSELRISQLLISGLDFKLEDTRVDPPEVIPLTDLELDLKRFTTLGLVERHPFTLRMRLSGGDVPLPIRERSEHLLLGVFSGVTSVFENKDSKKVETEERPCFDDLAVDISLALAPHLDGRIEARVRELELLAFARLAAASGVTIHDGLMNSKMTVELVPDEGMSVKSRTVFAHLSVSEPVGGPISSVLMLPAPLDTVLWALQDDKGRQVVPLHFKVASGTITRSQIVGQASAAFLKVVTSALASSPLRIGKGLLDFTGIGALTGLTDDSPPAIVGEEFEIDYEAGATAPPLQRLQELRPRIEEAASEKSVFLDLTAEFGRGDLERAEVLANPDPVLVYQLGERLRQRKAVILSERTRLARLAIALHTIGRGDQASSSSERIAALDEELALTERALDDAYDLLAPGADLRRARRTRDAAIEIANQRLRSLREELIRVSGGKLKGRIELRRPRFGDIEREGGGKVTIVCRLQS